MHFFGPALRPYLEEEAAAMPFSGSAAAAAAAALSGRLISGGDFGGS